jgi:hypothetical protein
MTIYRGKITAVQCRDLAAAATHDVRLSFKARGLILTILAEMARTEPMRAPTMTVASLTRLSTDGANAVRTGLQELAGVGYLGRGATPAAPGKIHYHVRVPAPAPAATG